MNNSARWKEWCRWWKDLRPQFYKCLDNRHLIGCIDHEMGELRKGRDGSQAKLDWFFNDMFLDFANDSFSKSTKGVRVQKHREVFKYNNNDYTVTFERGDKLNKGEMR
jgi:hypothetical protein